MSERYVITTKIRVWSDHKYGKEYKRYIITIPREIGERVKDKLVEITIRPLE